MRIDPTLIDAALVRWLVTAQFPPWADLPIVPVTPGGWDNRTFRLGETLRFSHSRIYLTRSAGEARLACRLLAPRVTRQEKGRDAAGWIGIFERRA